MSNVETRQAVPIGVKFFAELTTHKLRSPNKAGLINQPLLFTSGVEPSMENPLLLPSGYKTNAEDTIHPQANANSNPQFVLTKLIGSRPSEYHDARLFQQSPYNEPVRLNDEFGRTPSNRTQRRAEARETQHALQSEGKTRAEARRLARQAVELNQPLDVRLREKRVTIFQAKKQTEAKVPTPQPKTEATVDSAELDAAFENMVTEQVAPIVTEYLGTLETPQEKTAALAFLTYTLAIGAANLTPDAQIELIEAYHKKQAQLANAHSGKGSRVPPARVAGLLLATGLTLGLLAGCMPDNQTQATSESETTGLNEQQEAQTEQPTQNPPVISNSTPSAPGFTTEVPESPAPEPSPTPQIIEIVSLDNTPATPEQQDELTAIFNKLKNEQIIFGGNFYTGKELNNVLWFEDADPNNPTLNDYGREVDGISKENDVVKVFVDSDLTEGYFIGRTSEINASLIQHGLPPIAVNFNISSDSRLQGVDKDGNVVATRYKFERNDGTQVAEYPPEGAVISTEGYTFNGIFYRFDTNTGQFFQESISIPTPEPTPIPAQGEIRITENNTYEQFDGNQWNALSTEPEFILNSDGVLVYRTFDPESLQVMEITAQPGEGLKPFAEEFMIDGLIIDQDKAIGWSNLYWQAAAQNPANADWLNINGIRVGANTGEQIRTLREIPLTEEGPKIIMLDDLPGLLAGFESPTRFLHGQVPPSKIKTEPSIVTFTVEDYQANKNGIRDFVETIDNKSWGSFYDFGYDVEAGYLKVGTFVLPDGTPTLIIGSTQHGTHYKDTTLTDAHTAEENSLIVNATLATLITTQVNYIQENGRDFPYYNRPLEPRGVNYGILGPDLNWQEYQEAGIFPEHIPGYDEHKFIIIPEK